MSQTLLRRLDADEFLAWDLRQPDCRHELVDGVPVAMTGASRRHDAVVINIISALNPQLRPQGCRPFSADVAVRSPNGNVRRPDVGVRCPAIDDGASSEEEPVLLVEVLSPSTRSSDLIRKVDEYRSLPGLRSFLLVDPDVPEVTIWSKLAEGWTVTTLTGLDAVVDVSQPKIRLTFADVFEGLSFPPQPAL